MTVTREQLVADWRGRLADAEAVPIGESKRIAWLVRVRIRLYRFLLSLYGDAGWNAAPSSSADDSSGSVIFDSPDVLPLAGKPAKGEGTIRAVLKSVANAQDSRCPTGTFDVSSAARSGDFGLLAESGRRRALIATENWRIVASEEWNLDIHRCRALLKAKGIHPRLLLCSGHELLGVISHEQPKAARLIRQNRDKLQLPPPALPPTAPLPLWLRATATVVLFPSVTFIIALCLIAIMWQSQMPFRKQESFADLLYNAEFLRVWLSVAAVPLLVAYLLAERRKRLAKLQGQPAGDR